MSIVALVDGSRRRGALVVYGRRRGWAVLEGPDHRDGGLGRGRRRRARERHHRRDRGDDPLAVTGAPGGRRRGHCRPTARRRRAFPSMVHLRFQLDPPIEAIQVRVGLFALDDAPEGEELVRVADVAERVGHGQSFQVSFSVEVGGGDGATARAGAGRDEHHVARDLLAGAHQDHVADEDLARLGVVGYAVADHCDCSHVFSLVSAVAENVFISLFDGSDGHYEDEW